MIAIIPLIVFPIEDDGFHLKVKILINNQEAVLIVDTGASRSVFDETRIIRFIGNDRLVNQDRLSSGLGTNTMTSKKVRLDKLQLGKIKIEDYEATVLDLKHVNESYSKLDIDPVDGVLGGDIMEEYAAVIDYAKKEMKLFK